MRSPTDVWPTCWSSTFTSQSRADLCKEVLRRCFEQRDQSAAASYAVSACLRLSVKDKDLCSKDQDQRSLPQAPPMPPTPSGRCVVCLLDHPGWLDFWCANVRFSKSKITGDGFDLNAYLCWSFLQEFSLLPYSIWTFCVPYFQHLLQHSLRRSDTEIDRYQWWFGSRLGFR